MPKRARAFGCEGAPPTAEPVTSPVTPAKPPMRRARPKSDTPVVELAVPGVGLVTEPRVSFGDVQDVHDALANLSRADPVLGVVIHEAGVLPRLYQGQGVRATMNEPNRAFRALAKAVVFQQLNGAAASTIFARVAKLVGAETDATKLTPESISLADVTRMRACGLSSRKLEYLKGLSFAFSGSQNENGHYLRAKLSDEILSSNDDETTRRELLNLKGIGAWTVDMFFMFHMHRADVLPVGDFGVQKGMMLAYSLSTLPNPEQMINIAKKWGQTRTLGSFYMWHVADAEKEKKKSVLKGKKGKKG
jgi:DNA-3-methyladenine glycosylase II